MRHYFSAFLLFVSTIVYCQKTPIDFKTQEEWQVFDGYSKPTLLVAPSQNHYITDEAVALRFTLKNDSSSKIPIYDKALRFESSSISASICEEKESKGTLSKCYGLTPCWRSLVERSSYEYLLPGESTTLDFIIGQGIQTPGKYWVRASYSWRNCSPNTPSTEIGKCQHVYAEPVEISIDHPQDAEKQADQFLSIPRLLYVLQSPLYYCTHVCGDVKDIPCEDTKEFYISQAQKFLERFPKSVYARYMNYTMGLILKDQEKYQAAEVQMGKFISLYSEDWMVDDAMFEMAVCQIEQGKPDKAQATLESLFQKHSLTSAHQAKRVLENLKKGYNTLGEIYAH